MRNSLLTEGAYVQSLVDTTTPYADQATFILLSGFSVKNLPMPQGVIGAPTGLVRRMSDAISEDNIMIDWIKPTGLTSPNNAKTYNVYRNDGTGYTNIDQVTRTNYLDADPTLTHGSVYTYKVAAVNTDGEGAFSNELTVNF